MEKKKRVRNRWCFNLCIQHLEDPLEGDVSNDWKWLMALEHPKWDKVSQYSLAVWGHMCIMGNTLWFIDDLTLARFDMTEKIGCGILLMFLGENNRRISVGFWIWVLGQKRVTYVWQINWYLISSFSSIVVGGLKCLQQDKDQFFICSSASKDSALTKMMHRKCIIEIY